MIKPTTRNPFRKFLAAARVGALAVAAASVGCKSAPKNAAAAAPPSPSDVATVVGTAPAASVAEPAAPAAPTANARFETLRGSIFKADASSRYPDSSSGEVQRITVARAAARRDSLRGLTADLLRLQTLGGETLGSILRADPVRAEKLDQIIEDKSEITFFEAQGGERAEATLNGQIVFDALDLVAIQAAPEPAAVNTAEATERARESAIQQATDRARDQLFDAMLAAPVGEGTLRSEIGRNRDLERRLHEMVDRVPPSETIVNPNGEARVTMSIDRRAAVRALVGDVPAPGR